MRRLVFAVLLAVLVPFAVAEAQAVRRRPCHDHGERRSVTLELWPDVAPNHVKNFVGAREAGFYDAQRVHRVEPKFRRLQFGDRPRKTKP